MSMAFGCSGWFQCPSEFKEGEFRHDLVVYFMRKHFYYESIKRKAHKEAVYPARLAGGYYRNKCEEWYPVFGPLPLHKFAELQKTAIKTIEHDRRGPEMCLHQSKND